MNMDHSVVFDAMDAIVAVALTFGVGFSVAWLTSAKLRQWIERPKYGFQASIESFDRSKLREEKSPK